MADHRSDKSPDTPATPSRRQPSTPPVSPPATTVFTATAPLTATSAPPAASVYRGRRREEQSVKPGIFRAADLKRVSLTQGLQGPAEGPLAARRVPSSFFRNRARLGREALSTLLEAFTADLADFPFEFFLCAMWPAPFLRIEDTCGINYLDELPERLAPPAPIRARAPRTSNRAQDIVAALRAPGSWRDESEHDSPDRVPCAVGPTSPQSAFRGVTAPGPPQQRRPLTAEDFMPSPSELLRNEKATTPALSLAFKTHKARTKHYTNASNACDVTFYKRTADVQQRVKQWHWQQRDPPLLQQLHFPRAQHKHFPSPQAEPPRAGARCPASPVPLALPAFVDISNVDPPRTPTFSATPTPCATAYPRAVSLADATVVPQQPSEALADAATHTPRESPALSATPALQQPAPVSPADEQQSREPHLFPPSPRLSPELLPATAHSSRRR
ncbi:hypothetical protein ACSSS7_007092 [Eimeria intestinalis]